MNSTTVIRRLHQHRAWANHRLLDAADALSDEQLRQSFPVGQGSLWKTLLHLYAAEYVWLEALRGKPESLAPGDVAGKLPGNQEGEHSIPSLAQLRQHWAELDARYEAYLNTLTDAALDDQVNKVRTSGERFVFRRSDVLLHICTHAHYTIAQANNMLRHAGAASIPDPMVITLARSEPAIG
jgi:uncharacterized damage-inducible protein DinB